MIRQTISRIINAEFRIASLQVDKDGCFKTCQETNGHMAFLHEGKRNKCIIMHRYIHFIRLLVKIKAFAPFTGFDDKIDHASRDRWTRVYASCLCPQFFERVMFVRGPCP